MHTSRIGRPGSRARNNLIAGVFGSLLLASVASTALAQSIELSPAQQQAFNQLSPEQRRQAMDAMRQLQSQQPASSQQSINESVSIPVSIPASQSNPLSVEPVLDAVESTAKPRSRIVINFSPSGSVPNDPLLRALSGSHLFVLDESGMLSLQGLEFIPLHGLTEAEINRRLEAEPYLSVFDVDAHILGQKPVGVEALEPFGYDVFLPRDADLTAPSSGPVPADYVLGPGDSVRVQLYGRVNGIYEYEVSRDGILNLPEIGPVTVAGLPFSEFRQDLIDRVRQTLIGTQASVTMGLLRTIRVFVLGDVNQPGSYVVSGLATISGALYRSGGVSPIGSLRDVQLKRDGAVVSTFDAYELLINGNTSGNNRLQPGDVIFVPPIGKTVSVMGAVNRPAVYEVKRLTTAADLVDLAGGLTPRAYAGGARLERIDESGERTVISVDLRSASANSILTSKGDVLLIPEVLPELRNAVELSGHVHRPGNYPWRSGMRLTDLISSTEELQAGVDLDYILIRRESKRGEPLQVLSTSLAEALLDPGGADDLLLEAGDTVNVFSLALGRQRVVGLLLDELELQSTIDSPMQQVQVSGNVRAPGIYPFESGMRVSDLIRAGGNLSESAFALDAELTRYSVRPGGGRETEIVNIDIGAIRRGDQNADLVLREHDYLIINRVPDWDKVWVVTLKGEVMFPGTYRVRQGETLSDVLQRAGGLTANAYPEGAIFLREELKEQEQRQIATLTRRMEADLASLSLQVANEGGGETLQTGRTLLDQLKNTQAVGRLVIDLKQDIDRPTGGIELRDGDDLLVPTVPQVVTVLGEAQQNTSHLYRKSMSRDDYIDVSGGLTRRADEKRIYIVRANGAVIPGNRSQWLGRRQPDQIRPGDTIVVPLDLDRIRPLTFWGEVTQILYQGAIAVAAVRTFSD